MIQFILMKLLITLFLHTKRNFLPTCLFHILSNKINLIIFIENESNQNLTFSIRSNFPHRLSFYDTDSDNLVSISPTF